MNRKGGGNDGVGAGAGVEVGVEAGEERDSPLAWHVDVHNLAIIVLHLGLSVMRNVKTVATAQ